MKVRQGYVSNSSSASFFIPKDILTFDQIYEINHHIEIAKARFADKFEWLDMSDSWHISDLGDKIWADTIIDNFDFGYFLQLIGVDLLKVEAHYDN